MLFRSDYLVFYGLVMRDRSGGRHWIDRVSERINHWDSIFPRKPVAALEYIPEIYEADMEGLEEEIGRASCRERV